MHSSFPRRRLPTSAAVALAPIITLCPLGMPPVRADDTWDNTSADALWSTPGNWADDSEPLAGDDVTLPVGFPPAGTASTITLSAGEVAQSLAINDSYTLAGGSLTIGAGAVGAVTVAATKTATIHSNLTGASGLTKMGPGTLVLGASNSFTGAVTVSGGTLSVAADAALGAAGNPLTINNGILLATQSFATSRSISLGTSGAIDVSASRTVTVNAPLTSGAGVLVVGPSGSGTLVLTAPSPRTGATTVQQGTVRLDHGQALGSGQINLGLNSFLELNNVTVDQPATLTSSGTIRGRGANATYAGTITVGAGHIAVIGAPGADTLTIGNAANDLTGGANDALIFVAAGSGTTRLPFANNYAGGWQVNGGTLHVGHSTALGTGTTPVRLVNNGNILELANGVTLDRDVAMEKNSAILGVGTTAVTGTITVGAGAQVTFGGFALSKLTLGDATNDLTGGGGGATVRKTAPGTLELTQASDLSAGWWIQGGSVIVKPGAQLGGNGGAGASAIDSLTLDFGTRLDLTSNAVVVRSAAIGTAVGATYNGLTGLVQSARNGGTWDGAGIHTSEPVAANGLTAIGIATADASGYAGSAFGGVNVLSGDVIAMYTYAGDANLDGFISGDDYSAIDFAASVPGASGWANGDFNYDGVISGDDYSTIDFNLIAQGAPFPTGATSTSVIAVPEPACVLVMTFVGAGLINRRQR